MPSKNHTKENNEKISRKTVKTKNYRKITSHRPLILVPQNKQGINISLSHVGSHIFFHNIAANDVNNTTHIYSSKSADQLISTRSSKEFIPSETYKQINKKPEHEP
jgi:hypothetical protein